MEGNPAESICPCYQAAHLSSSHYSKMRGSETNKLQAPPAVIVVVASEKEGEEGKNFCSLLFLDSRTFFCIIQSTVAQTSHIKNITIYHNFKVQEHAMNCHPLTQAYSIKKGAVTTHSGQST